jgi:hypothetical protein
MHTFKYYPGDGRPKLISRRPRQFAKTRLSGGAEIEPWDDTICQRLSYEYGASPRTIIPAAGASHD